MVFPWGFPALPQSLLHTVVCDSGPSFRNGKWLEQQLQGSRGQRSASSKASLRVECCGSFPHSLAGFWALMLFCLKKEKRPLTGSWGDGVVWQRFREAAVHREASRSEHWGCKFLGSRLDCETILIPRLLYLSLSGEKCIWGKHSNFKKCFILSDVNLIYADILNFKSNVLYVRT